MSNPVLDFPWDKINVAATSTAVAGPCHLHAITFNGVTTGGTVVVYDGTDAGGTVIATYNILGVSVSYQGITLSLIHI